MAKRSEAGDSGSSRTSSVTLFDGKRHSSLLNALSSPIFFKDLQGRYTDCNTAFLDFIGLPSESVIGKTSRDIAPLDNASRYEEMDADLLREGGIQIYEYTVRTASGETRDVMFRKSVLRDDNDQPIGIAGEILDITQRKRAEEALHNSEEHLRIIADNTYDWEYWRNPQGRYIWVSPSCRELTGYSPEDFTGDARLTIGRIIHPDDQQAWRKHIREVDTSVPDLSEFEVRLVKKSGEIIWISHICKPIFGSTGEYLGRRGCNRDISTRKQAEEDKYQAERSYRELVEHAPIGIFRSTPQGRFLMANTQLAEMYGYDSVQELLEATYDIGKQHYADPNDRVKFINDLDQKDIRGLTTRRLRKDGSLIFVVTSARAVRDKSGNLMYYEGFTSDISSHIKMEQTMLMTEKLFSLGGLAAGMAHEINNPLAGMMQSAQVIATRFSPDVAANIAACERTACDMNALQAYLKDREILVLLEGIRKSGKQANAIVSNILSFCARSTSTLMPIDLNSVVENAVDLFKQGSNRLEQYDPKLIVINREYELHDLQVPCFGNQIQQVVLNLLLNAAQAMAGACVPEPTITLRTRSDGAKAIIEVEDNGPGMEESVRKRAFEPFFTTKKVGTGTGLGLSVSYFIIVNQHHGTIEVTSSPGQGTRFIIDLPLQQAPLANDPDALPPCSLKPSS
jgi:PAS domain S-box-containing protein